MTELLCHHDSYMKEFDARVVEVNPAERAVALDRTAFFPGGGGQPADRGWLNGAPVTRVARQGDVVWHWLDGDPPATGTMVQGKLDWDRRHRLMRMHTSGHLLCSVFYSKANCRITGNQIEVDKSRMDFNLDQFDRSLIEGFVAEANRLISHDAPVKTYFMPRDEALKVPELVKLAEAAPPNEAQLRIVEIEGIDKQADGGVHVASLKELGEIRLVKLENKGKTNRRLYYELTP